MARMLIIVWLTTAGRGALQNPQRVPVRWTWTGYFSALRLIESEDGKKLTGDGGKSLGPYHIGELCWKDVMRAQGLDWPYKDSMREDRASYVVFCYAWLYEPVAAKNRDFWTLAALHNGGPQWRNKPAAHKHADRVLREMALPAVEETEVRNDEERLMKECE